MKLKGDEMKNIFKKRTLLLITVIYFIVAVLGYLLSTELTSINSIIWYILLAGFTIGVAIGTIILLKYNGNQK